MNGKLLQGLSKITDEEKKILSGGEIDKSIYSDGNDFTVLSGKISREEKLVGLRPHTRFAPFPKHRHNYIELIYTCKGTTKHTVNSTDNITLKEGELLLLGTNAVHEVAAAGAEDIAVNFIIKPEFFTVTMEAVGYGNTIYNFIMTELSRNGEASYMLFNVSGILPIQNLIENLIWSLYFTHEDNYAVQNMTMGLLFCELADRSEAIVDYSPLKYEQDIVLKTAQYVENCFKDAKLTDLSEQLHIPTVTLSKIIKKYSGATFKSLLQKKRLQEAEKLIRNTDIPITEIIYSVGYENTNFFYRLFDSQYGYSPKTYRKIYSPKNRLQ